MTFLWKVFDPLPLPSNLKRFYSRSLSRISWNCFSLGEISGSEHKSKMFEVQTRTEKQIKHTISSPSPCLFLHAYLCHVLHNLALVLLYACEYPILTEASYERCQRVCENYDFYLYFFYWQICCLFPILLSASASSTPSEKNSDMPLLTLDCVHYSLPWSWISDL